MQGSITTTAHDRAVLIRSKLSVALGSSGVLWLVGTSGLTALFVSIAAIDLSNFRPVSNDDIWIMSASYKLATEGVFGSDLYAGFYNADRHYFIALPGHHLLQALTFRLFGVGIAQARLVSLAGSALLIVVVSRLAYRWHGLAAALLAIFLLVWWRCDLTAAWPGLPLLSVSRSGRYDIGAVALAWLALLFFDRLLRHPGRLTALAVGLAAGLATLTQFFGAAIVPVIALGWLWQRGREALKHPLSHWMAGGFLVLIVPYGLYIAVFLGDFAGQSSLKEGRTAFTAPHFYIENVVREPTRFAHLLRRPLPGAPLHDAFSRPLSPWLLLMGSGPAVVYLIVRTRRNGAAGDRLLALNVIGTGLFLAVVDQTKAPLYAIVLLPGLSLALAVWMVAAVRWAREQLSPLAYRAGVGVLLVPLALGVAGESAAAYLVDLRQSREVSAYMDVGGAIASHLTPGATVLGAERWWWALRRYPYLSLNSVWAQWRSASNRNGQLPEFRDWMDTIRPDFIIVNADVLRAHPDTLHRQYIDFLAGCAHPVAQWADPTYGPIELYRLPKNRSGAFDC